MPRPRFLVLEGWLLLALMLAAGAASAEPFVSPDGRFAVAFPAQPDPDRSRRDTWAGRMEEGSYDLDREGLFLRVEFHDVPKMARMLLPPAVLLDLARRGLLADRKAANASSERVSLRGYPGLALRYVPAERPESVEEARLFLVGDRLYVTFARADSDGEPQQAVRRFLASFDAWEERDAFAAAAGTAGAGM